VPSVLWHCWLSSKKGIQPVKNWVMGCWHGYLFGEVEICMRPNWCHCHSLSRLVLSFSYQLTRVIPDKGLLNGCCCFFVGFKHVINVWCLSRCGRTRTRHQFTPARQSWLQQQIFRCGVLAFFLLPSSSHRSSLAMSAFCRPGLSTEVDTQVP